MRALIQFGTIEAGAHADRGLRALYDDGVPQALTLPVLTERERLSGIESEARVDFARGDDSVQVFERCKRV